MPKSLFKSFLPWLVYFVFAVDNEASIKIGTTIALLIFVSSGITNLRNKYYLEMASAVFFPSFFILTVLFDFSWLTFHSLIFAPICLLIMSLMSLKNEAPFTMQFVKESGEEVLLPVHKKITIGWSGVFIICTLLSFVTANFTITLIILASIVLTIIYPTWQRKRLALNEGTRTIASISPLKIASLKNAKIAYRRLGRGRPLLMLPGFNMSMYSFGKPFLQELSKSYEIFLVDYPGIGSSSWTSGDFNAKDLAALFAEFTEFLKLPPVALLGFSLGGSIALQMAISYPHALSHLILIATDPGGQRALMADPKVLSKILNSPVKHASILFREDLIPKYLSLLNTSILEEKIPELVINEEKRFYHEWYQNNQIFSQLSLITLPTLIISGEDDLVVPTHNARTLGAHIKNSRLTLIPSAGHGILYQCPEEVASHISKFTA